MSRTPYDDINGEAGAVSGDKPLTMRADGQETIALPDSNFVQNAEILREGQDLILEGPDGSVIVIEGYFNADPAPLLQAPTGEALTPDLVDSFVQHSGPAQYADAGSMNDASPVGSVQEISGKATITRADGTTESITIGTPVYEGDIVETHGDSAVNIGFIDETSFSVSNNAKLSIDEYVFDPDSQSGQQDFSVLRGLFVFTSGLIGRDDPDDVNIDTPMGSIGIRGTTIAGNADTGEITVMEGAIVLRSHDGSELTLSEQFETAQFDPLNGSAEHKGQKAPDAFNTDFNSIKAVEPTLFSALENTDNQPDAAPKDPQQPGKAPSLTQPDAAPDGTDTAPAPVDGDQPLPPSPDGTLPPPNDDGLPPPPESDPFFDNQTDAGFDDGAGLSTDGDTTQPPLLNNPPPPPDSTSGALPPPPPPPDSGSTTTTNNPPPPPPPPGGGAGGPLFLNALGGPNGFIIPGAPASGEGFGYSVAFLGDTDSDGYSNFMVANNIPSSAEVFEFNGNSNLSVMQTVAGPNDTSMAVVDGVGDFDGDGTLDYIAGTPFSDSPMTGAGNYQLQGSAFVAGINSGDLVGHSVAGIGDVDGDGYNDALIGAAGTDNGGIDRGTAYVMFGNGSPTTQDAGAMTQGLRIDNVTNNQFFGEIVSGAGDFDNDGYADFMVSYTTGVNTGEVMMFMGDNASVNFDNIADAVHTFTGIGTDGNDVPIMKMGDINGDGISDIGIADTMSNLIHILYGGGSTDTNLSDGVNAGQGFTIFNSGPGEVVSGGSAGDFNGDGYDDGVFIVRDGSIADVFVVYGRPGASGMLDTQSLYNNDAAAFHGVYNIGHTGTFNFEVSTAGDANGDGFDDILIGTPDEDGGDGAVAVLYGRNDSAQSADGQMVHIAGQTTVLNDVVANANNQHLVGNNASNTMQANGFAGIDMRGGAGDDTMVINNTMIGNLDGGGGVDKIEFFGPGQTLDFANMGSEKISGIEKIVMNGNNQTVTLGLDDIFRLMQESQDIENIGSNVKTLKLVDLSGGITNFDIEDNGSTSPFTPGTPDTTFADGGITFDVYFHAGGYALLIDQNIDNVNVV